MKTKEYKKTTLVLDSKTFARFKMKCAKYQVTMSEKIRQIIQDYLNQS